MAFCHPNNIHLNVSVWFFLFVAYFFYVALQSQRPIRSVKESIPFTSCHLTWCRIFSQQCRSQPCSKKSYRNYLNSRSNTASQYTKSLYKPTQLNTRPQTDGLISVCSREKSARFVSTYKPKPSKGRYSDYYAVKNVFFNHQRKKHNLSISIEKKQRPLMSKCKVFTFFSFFRELLQVKSRVSAVPMLPLQKLCWTLRIGLSSIAVRIKSGSTILNSNSGCSEPAANVCRMSVCQSYSGRSRPEDVLLKDPETPVAPVPEREGDRTTRVASRSRSKPDASLGTRELVIPLYLSDRSPGRVCISLCRTLGPLVKPKLPKLGSRKLVASRTSPLERASACLLCEIRVARCETLVETEEHRSLSSFASRLYAKLHLQTGHKPSTQYGIKHSTKNTWSHLRGRTRTAPGGILCPDAQQASNLSLVNTTTSPNDWSLRFKASKVSSSTRREANCGDAPSPLPASCRPFWLGKGMAEGIDESRCRESTSPTSRTRRSRDIWSKLSETECTLENKSDCDCWNSLASFSSSIVFATTSRFKAVASETFEVFWSCAWDSWACSCLFWPGRLAVWQSLWRAGRHKSKWIHYIWSKTCHAILHS